jgi:hypothetical protein
LVVNADGDDTLLKLEQAVEVLVEYTQVLEANAHQDTQPGLFDDADV